VRLVFNKVTYWENRNDLDLPTSAYLGPVAQGGQGPPPMLAERFQSVITQLFQQV
jgi:ATP-dependent Clp protease protease subunit